MKASEFRPRHLNVIEFTANQLTQSGQEPLSTFERLRSGLHADASPQQLAAVEWSITGELRRLHGGATENWIHLQARATIPLECQRCLERVDTPLDIDRHFLFVGSEDRAAQLDSDKEEDVLVLSRNFDLLELIEDELVLAMPLIPRHEVCPVPVKLSASDIPPEELEPEDARPNPFAALAGWHKSDPKK
jgi:uncharacterized protein